MPIAIYSTTKQVLYKGMSVEASCRKFLDALAKQIYSHYDFKITYENATMGNVLFAMDNNKWKNREEFGAARDMKPLNELFEW